MRNPDFPGLFPADRVAMLMGHQDLATTAIYTTPSREDLTAAVEKIAWQD